MTGYVQFDTVPCVSFWSKKKGIKLKIDDFAATSQLSSKLPIDPLPDDAELEAVVAPALYNRGVTHLHCRGVRSPEVLLLLDGLLHRLRQLTVAHLLFRADR